MGEASPEFTEINRSRAKAVKERLARMGLTVTLGQAYEVVAVAHGYRNWPVMKSAAPANNPSATAVKEWVEIPDGVEQLISQFKDFIELRQKRFLPRNKVLVFSDSAKERRAFVENVACNLALDVISLDSGADVSEIDSVFSTSFRQRKLIFIDAVERLDTREGGNANYLCACLDEMPPSQFVIMGSRSGPDTVSLSVLRRAPFRHRLDG